MIWWWVAQLVSRLKFHSLVTNLWSIFPEFSFYCIAFFIDPFFNIFFTLIYFQLAQYLLLKWFPLKEILCNLLLNHKCADPWSIFLKIFSIPANRMFGILLDETSFLLMSELWTWTLIINLFQELSLCWRKFCFKMYIYQFLLTCLCLQLLLNGWEEHRRKYFFSFLISLY